MKPMRRLLPILAIFSLTLSFGFKIIRAEDCNLHCLEEQIKELEEKKRLSEAATAPLESEVVRLANQIRDIEAKVVAAEKRLELLAESIQVREKELADDYAILASRVKQFYKRSRSISGLFVVLSSNSATNATRELSYQAAVKAEDRAIITATTEELLQLERDSKQLEQDQIQLADLRTRLDAQATFYQVEIDKAKQYQATLTSQIAELSKRQQEILSAKASTFQTSVGDVPIADDPASRPDYDPGFSPAFAAFSFGAPHYKGMSQYGAYGRAKEGQSAEEILKAYYGDGLELKKDYSTDITLTVDNYGGYNIEDYTKRIYEMPASWGDNGGMEALKAQAVAARSYALARTNNGAQSICPTEYCQVFKPGEKGGKWNEAVEATRGWVLTYNGQPFSTLYASTSGGYQESYSYNGYSTPALWDTKSGRSGWTSEAYEKIGGSPWFYKGWYKDRSGDACGRSHPWLTGEEMADILNAWVVLIKHGQSDDRVTPSGGCWGGNPYASNELRDRAQGLSTGYSRVTDVSITYADNGVTAHVDFTTDKGSVQIDGLEFKKAFNLRAPGKVSLKSGLFNIEQK